MVPWSKIETTISSTHFSSLNNNMLLEHLITVALTEINVSQEEMEKQGKRIQQELEKMVVLNTDCRTLLKFIAKERLNRAKEILCKTKSPKIAAFSTGFKDLSNFSKQFKKEYNLTPREFLKQQAFL